MAIRIPRPNTPTDGTLLTSARKVADEWYQPPLPKQGPQWRLWANLPEVELWQAIALSCDIEPKYYLGDADPEFQLRMRIAIGNGLGKGDRPHCALVTLTDVARLARRCGWTLPPEFPGANPLEHAQDPMPPNWDRWLHVPSIELGNAIALSLDIDPQCLSSGRHLIPDTFVTRLQVAIEHLRPGGVLSDFSGEARENSIVVTLQAVARLANFCRWTLPPEFPKPVAEQPRSAGAKPLPEEVKHSDDEMAATPAVEQPTCAEAQPIPSGEQIPGKLPRIAVGRLAVKAAWEIELETKRAATVPDVMKRLQSWADEGKEPEYLIRSDRKKKCVVWNAGGKEKDYDEKACGKAIERWKINRR